MSLDALTFDDGEGHLISWESFVETTYTDALIVLYQGSIVYETYRNGMTLHTPHHCFSVSKSFVGLLAEMLIADGKLDPAAPVTAYVPELVQSGFAQASVRDLLDMTDGVAFDEGYANPDADIHRYSASYWTPSAAKGGARETLARLTARDHAPGEGFSYRTPVADALGWGIERATGKRLADVFAALLWQPAGCEDDGHFLIDTAGHEIAASGLNATMRDLARLALLMMEENPAIPTDARASIIGGGNRALLAASRHAERSSGSYRSQWWVSHNSFGGIAAMGVYGQRVYVEPATGFALLRFGSHPLASSLYTDAIHQCAIEALRRAVT
jgi:CubicO group peptidase (beta-lactamase class C family)